MAVSHHRLVSQRAGKSPYLYWQLRKETLSQPLTIPVEGITQRQLNDTWGASRSAGRKHEGIDIFAKRGTPVLSATQGIIRNIGTNNLGGKVIWVTGPGAEPALLCTSGGVC